MAAKSRRILKNTKTDCFTNIQAEQLLSIVSGEPQQATNQAHRKVASSAHPTL